MGMAIHWGPEGQKGKCLPCQGDLGEGGALVSNLLLVCLGVSPGRIWC